jgi:DNA-binding response OmpR family regulator
MDRILIVEDDQALQKVLKRLFESEGYEVEIRADGKSALEAIRKTAPTAIILDLGWPEISGQDVYPRD